MWLTKSSCIAMRVSTALTLRQAIWEKVRPRIVAKLKKVEDVRAPPPPPPARMAHQHDLLTPRVCSSRACVLFAHGTAPDGWTGECVVQL